MEKTRKQVGKIAKENSLRRLYQLNQFLKSVGLFPKPEPNIQPIRKIVGRITK